MLNEIRESCPFPASDLRGYILPYHAASYQNAEGCQIDPEPEEGEEEDV